MTRSSQAWSMDAALAAPHGLAIHLDLVGGLAGDMFVAGMIDALPVLQAPVLAALAAVQPAGAPGPLFTTGTSAGLQVRRFGLDRVDPHDTATPHHDAAATHRHAATTHHDTATTDHDATTHHDAATTDHDAAAGPHGTAYVTLRRTIQEAPLDERVRRHAIALLDLLADAEAQVHGVTLDAVHFHELADWDSLMDVVAAGCIAALLEGARWSASAIPAGRGTVRTAHGLLPVPAPATTALLHGYPLRDDAIRGERVTPTGAAILRHLVAPGDCDRGAAGTLRRTGFGAGTRNLPGVPNVVRVLVLERSDAGAGPLADASFDEERIATLAFDIDDMTGEELALAADRLRAANGVMDVTLGTRAGKKGRPVADFRVLVQPAQVEAVVALCLAQTTTLGLRVSEERRVVLRRTSSTHLDEHGPLRVKMAQRPDGTITAKAEHDDVASRPSLRERRAARDEATGAVIERRKP